VKEGKKGKKGQMKTGTNERYHSENPGAPVSDPARTASTKPLAQPSNHVFLNSGHRAPTAAFFSQTSINHTPREARHPDDTEGVAALSPGLAESARPTPGYHAIQPITFERSEASEASILRCNPIPASNCQNPFFTLKKSNQIQVKHTESMSLPRFYGQCDQAVGK